MDLFCVATYKNNPCKNNHCKLLLCFSVTEFQLCKAIGIDQVREPEA